MNRLWISLLASGLVLIPVTSAVEPSERVGVGQTRLLALTEKTKSSFVWVPPGDSWLGGGKDKEGQILSRSLKACGVASMRSRRKSGRR
jgi:hypothetical protein